MLAQLLDAPIINGYSDDRAVQQSAALQAIERAEGHHPGQVAGDAEDDQRVRLGVMFAVRHGSEAVDQALLAGRLAPAHLRARWIT